MRINPRFLAISFLSLVGLCGSLVSPAVAQEGFFQGKTIRIIVGFSAGGGFDAYSRTIGRHMGKYIPGKSVELSFSDQLFPAHRYSVHAEIKGFKPFEYE